ncbi:MAG: 9-O-acetylesterase [Candidatus Hydrogenedentota bacterium]
MTLLKRFSFAVAISVVLAFGAQAELWMPSVFTDHMVLQQKSLVPVWGKAAPGAAVKVAIADREASATANTQGQWRVKIGPFPAGGPHTLTVTVGEETKTINDVLFGEVWVCSGQSNMVWWVNQSNDAEAEIAAANYPNIRLYKAPNVTSDTPKDDIEAAWAVCAPETVPEFSGVAYYFGRKLHQDLGVPVGLVLSAWGGTPAEAWTSLPKLQANAEFEPLLARWNDTLAAYPEAKAKFDEALKAWEAEAEKAKSEGKEPPAKPRAPMGPDSPHRPANLYNAMINPLIPYGMRGAIWYQGESNASRAYQYRALFADMIKDWRERWGQGAFPFYFVQLANFSTNADTPDGSPWAELREAQTMALSLPNTGMAVITDIGDPADIHPRNKQDVGKRLAQWALRYTYGRADVPPSGPLYKAMKVLDGGKVSLEFDHVYGGLKAKEGGLAGFTVAGEDKKFVEAKAEISGDTVHVWSDQVALPVAVRYAWSDNPPATLYNGADLPASPFRTDDWPGVTVENK